MKYSIILSIVTAIQDVESLNEFLVRAISILDSCAENYELLIICNGFDSQIIKRAKRIASDFAKVRLIFLSDYHTMDVAMMAGVENCIGDYCIVMDSVSDPVEFIPEILKIAVNDNDIVIASNGYKRYTSWYTRITAKIYYRFVSYMLQKNIEIDPSYFTCFSRKALTGLAQFNHSLRNYRLLRTTLGFSTEKVKYTPISSIDKLQAKVRRTPLTSRIESFFSYSYLPLRYFSTMAFFLGLFNYMYLIYVLFSWTLRPDIANGWTSTSILYGVMFGFLFIFLGVFGWYLSILITETKRTPLFQISDEFNSGTPFSDWKKKNVV